jgi:hypothetical protein
MLLKPHPTSNCFAAARIEVGIAQPRADSLMLSYAVTGKMNNMRLPPVMNATRSDKLWQHTCFEAFVRASSGAEYYEFNFSPSTQWAAYRFNDYRSGMRVADEVGAPPIEVQSNADSYTLQASLELNRLSWLSRQGSWRLGLSALIEDRSGGKSYWALAHPPGKPDFHHTDCFAHEFFPVEQP